MTAPTSQKPRRGFLVLNPVQAGLVSGLFLIVLVAAFAGGFMAGMWYQTSERIAPYDVSHTATPEPPTPSRSTPVPATPALPALSHTPAPAAPESASDIPPASSTATTEPVPPDDSSTVTPQPPAEEPVTHAAPAASDAREPLTHAAPVASEAVTPAAPPATAVARPRPAEPERAETPPVAPAVQSAAAAYSVQVGSFRARAEAERLQGRLAGKGYATYIQTTQVPGKGIWYRVRVGQFADRATAAQTAGRLETQEHLAVFVTRDAP